MKFTVFLFVVLVTVSTTFDFISCQDQIIPEIDNQFGNGDQRPGRGPGRGQGMGQGQGGGRGRGRDRNPGLGMFAFFGGGQRRGQGAGDELDYGQAADLSNDIPQMPGQQRGRGREQGWPPGQRRKSEWGGQFPNEGQERPRGPNEGGNFAEQNGLSNDIPQMPGQQRGRGRERGGPPGQRRKSEWRGQFPNEGQDRPRGPNEEGNFAEQEGAAGNNRRNRPNGQGNPFSQGGSFDQGFPNQGFFGTEQPFGQGDLFGQGSPNVQGGPLNLDNSFAQGNPEGQGR